MISEYNEGERVDVLLTQPKVVGKNGRTIADFDPLRGENKGTLVGHFGDDNNALRMVEVKLDSPNMGCMWLTPTAVAYVNGVNGGGDGVR